MSHPMPAPTVVFVHGAWCGPWIWERTRHYLPDYTTAAVDLPSTGRDGAELGDLHDDATVLREAVTSIGGPVVVVAHSYGGMVATQALADCPNVQQIIYLAALVPDEQESPYDLLGRSWPDGLNLTDSDNTRDLSDSDRVTLADPWTLFSDADPRAGADAVERLTPQSFTTYLDSLDTVPAWHAIPSTYVLCTRDQALHPAAQAVYSARCDEVRRLRSDHFPQISQPDALADLIRNETGDPHGGYRG